MARMSNTHATAPACQIVRRTRTESSMVLLRARAWRDGGASGFVLLRKNVARAAPRVQQGFVRRRVNLSTDAIYVHFEQIRERIKLFVPDVFRDFCAAHDTSFVARQKLQQCVFFCGE